MKYFKNFFFSTFVILIIYIIYSYFNYDVQYSYSKEKSILKNLKNKTDEQTKQKLKEYIFPYKYNSLYKKKLKELDNKIINLQKKIESKNKIIDKLIKKNGVYFYETEKKNININKKKKTFTKFTTDHLLIGKYEVAKSTSYLEVFEDKFILSTATGTFLYTDIENLEKNDFFLKPIASNLSEIIKYNEFYIRSYYGIKDILIKNDKIYISYSNQSEANCYNTAILYADINFKKLNFKKFFSPKICVKEKNLYGEYDGTQGGGRLVDYSLNEILFSTGEYKFRDHAQNKKNVLGKIISINLKNQKSKIVSMGHRNPQGLYYDKNNNYIISTEHGPVGGDEINLNIQNEANLDSKKIIKNYGWPISSYGEHYNKNKRDYSEEIDGPLYKKAPFHKSHKKYGFIEPLKVFTPAIGISQIIKIPSLSHEEFFVGGMGFDPNEGDLSIHHLKYNKKFSKLIEHNIILLNERIRDMIFVENINKVFLFLESSASIGIIDLNS